VVSISKLATPPTPSPTLPPISENPPKSSTSPPTYLHTFREALHVTCSLDPNGYSPGCSGSEGENKAPRAVGLPQVTYKSMSCIVSMLSPAINKFLLKNVVMKPSMKIFKADLEQAKKDAAEAKRIAEAARGAAAHGQAEAAKKANKGGA
jgi:hypothetical protein